MEKKKEIGIEKLIRYLLESKGEEYKEEYYEWYRDVELEQNIDSLSELRLFVKWLVDNDKIDFNKVSKKEIESRLSIVMGGVFIETNWVLMLLSISDTPIDDLVSYLR